MKGKSTTAQRKLVSAYRARLWEAFQCLHMKSAVCHYLTILNSANCHPLKELMFLPS